MTTEPTPTNEAAARRLGATAAYWAALDAVLAAGKAYADQFHPGCRVGLPRGAVGAPRRAPAAREAGGALMTKKMAKAQQDEMFSIAHDVRDMLAEYASARDAAAEMLDAIVVKLNEARVELHTVLDSFASDAEGYFDERSDKWQEGDAGSVYSDWKDELRRLADEVEEEVEAPELPELEEPSWVGEVEEGAFVTFEG